MKEFALLFRQPALDYGSLSDNEVEALRRKWADWAGAIAAEGRLVEAHFQKAYPLARTGTEKKNILQKIENLH